MRPEVSIFARQLRGGKWTFGDSSVVRRVGTTPESSKGPPKINFSLKAVVFKSGKRVLPRL